MRTRLAIALVVVALGVPACGDSDEAPSGVPTTAQPDIPVVIQLRVKLPHGRVLPTSQLGNFAFCPGGTTLDGAGATNGLIVTTFECPDGGLQITFSPTPDGLKQSGTWSVVPGSGTGSFAGVHGSGEMTAEFEDEKSGKALAEFIGTMGLSR